MLCSCQLIKTLPTRARPVLLGCVPDERKNKSSFFSSEPTRKQQPRASNPNIYRDAFLSSELSQPNPVRKPLAYYKMKQSIRARASNPTFFQDGFDIESSNNLEPYRGFTRQHKLRKNHRKETEVATVQEPKVGTVSDYLEKYGELRHVIPKSTWVRIDNIPPISSLDAMISGIDNVLDAEETDGIIDIDQVWNPSDGEETIQILPPMPVVEKNPKWVRNARLILSPFSRPKGWFIQFDNRSIVHALLAKAIDVPVKCSYRAVKVSACKVTLSSETEGAPEYSPVNEDANSFLDERISDHTLRVENCPWFTTKMSLINYFSRYDLKDDAECVQKWNAITTDGKRGKSTYVVHFDDEYWARAALREKQSTFLNLNDEAYNVDPRHGPLLLAQYPKQMW